MMGSIFDNFPFIKIDEKTNCAAVQYDAIRIFYYATFFFRYHMGTTVRCTKNCKSANFHSPDKHYERYEDAPPCFVRRFDNILEGITEIVKSKTTINQLCKEVNSSSRRSCSKPGGISRAKSRYECMLFIVHFINHAIGCFPGSKFESIRTLSYPNNLYINVSESALIGCDMEKLRFLGISDENRMISYSPVLYEYPPPTKRRKKTIVNANNNSNDLFEFKTPWYSSCGSSNTRLELDIDALKSLKSLEQAICMIFEIE